MKLITTFSELDQWLEENNYFEDGHILQINLDPLAITVGYNIKGNFQAHSEREILPFKITPNKIMKWEPSEHLVPSEDHYIEGIEPLDMDPGIGLQFLVPPLTILVAESLTVEDLPIIKTTFKPWLSTHSIFAKAPLHEIPKPAFWQQRLKEAGYEVVFRYYAGEGKRPEELPLNYTGYFIQLAERIDETQEGIFIEFMSLENQEVSLGFSRRDPTLDSVWLSLTAIVADIPDVIISCGNCKFSGGEWKLLLKNKKYPPTSDTFFI